MACLSREFPGRFNKCIIIAMNGVLIVFDLIWSPSGGGERGYVESADSDKGLK